MIHHISISARNPLHVAQVLAEILEGTAFPFPPVPGSFVAMSEDGYGTLVEVYPMGTEMVPGQNEQDVQLAHANEPSDHTATHAALSVTLDETRIKDIATREGWRAIICDRGGIFQVIEFWIENRIMFELLTQDMARDYLEAMKPKKWARYIERGMD